jgi:hypothetical protein
MGVEKDARGKAQKDFGKRTATTPPEERQRSVFVFVTPRSWPAKDEWAREQASRSDWRNVVVLDANDLEHWLELAPEVDVWFAGLSGRPTEGVQHIQAYWHAVHALAGLPLTPSVFTASRESETALVRDWLAGPPSSLFLRTNGLTDGLDFLAALSSRSEESERLHDALIVYTAEAWRRLAASREALILVAAPTIELQASDTAGAVAAGHHVFVSGLRGVVAPGIGELLRRQNHLAIADALQESGFSHARAATLGKACCGSSSILKRLITRHPETRFPAWSRDDVRAALAPFALVGGWSHVDPPAAENANALGWRARDALDVWVVTELVGCTRETLDAIVARWQRDAEPLFLRLGTSVLVASREDAWHLLGGALTPEQLKRFRDLALLVLEEDNPAFELAADQRWLASLHGKTHSLSEELRRSIVETLALMTIYPAADAPDMHAELTAAATWVMERALPHHASWQRWASLGHNLPVIAEAAPKLFLSRVEDDLRSSDPELPKLFQDTSATVFTGAIHTDLLWALEGLAWSPEYFPRVTQALAILAARDPGGKYANRPANSLRELFLLWLWHTNASVEQRIQALSRVVEAEPKIGWQLLTDILPGGMQGVSHNTHMPRWREWAEGWSREAIQEQRNEYALAVAELTLRLAVTNARRWSQVLDGMLHFSPEITAKVLAGLDTVFEHSNPDAEEVFSLWKALHALCSRHERYSHARWAFPASVRSRLAAIRDRLEPRDPVLRHYWLFEPRVDLPACDPTKDYQAYDQALTSARLEALREIVAVAGIQGIVRLLPLARNTSVAGWLIGWERLLSWEELGRPTALDATDTRWLGCIRSYIEARFAREGWGFPNGVSLAGSSPQHIAAFACCLPFRKDVWDWVGGHGGEVEGEYWSRVPVSFRQIAPDEVGVAARSLIAAGRPFSAISALHAAISPDTPLPSDLIGEVLESALVTESTEDAAGVGDVQYAVQQLVKSLQDDAAFERARLARIEWELLPLLDPEFSEVGPETLIREVESTPGLFVDLLTLVYRGENESPREIPLSGQDLIRARHARKLLDNLRRLPGTDERGAVSCDQLRPWIESVRSLAAQHDRPGMCDHTLGEIFARACQRHEDNWPPLAVATVAEEIGSDSFFHGLVIGVLNARGVVTRDPWAGGTLERDLSGRYRQLAQYVREASPRLAEAFLQLANEYERDSRHEDEDAERSRLGR